MCGIAGYVKHDGVERDDGVAGMVHGLRHRGPDDAGVWRSTDGCCVLGHTRLSIIDLSALGSQPMLDTLTGNAIVFNGEIYNFQQLRTECEARGDCFNSQTDTEVILAMYRRYGVDCLKYLRGMFSFALWDASKQLLFLARDRVGKKPLNYALLQGGIIFSSELAPLAHHPAVTRDLDEEALELYLQLQYIPAPWTIYRAIRKLPPAHFAVWDRGGLRIIQYWNVDYRPKVRITEQEALDGLEEKLREAVKLRMISDVPLGALLSGGVDSSLVVALMAGLGGQPVKTFSIGFQDEAFNELPYANTVAERYNTQHCPRIVSGEVEPLLPRLVKHYGEPFADSSAVPSFHVCRTARDHVTVVLNGDGGDELLGGYSRYCISYWSIASGRILGNLKTARELARLVPGLQAARSIPARARRKWLLRFAYPELQSMTMYSAYWNDPDRGKLLESTGKGQEPVLDAWRSEWLGKARDAADNPVDRMLWMDNRTYLPGDLLTKMDIASMHCGLEARSPLLDHEVIEFCASLPANLKVKRKTGKYLLKRLAERYLPNDLIYRRKMGFGIPLAAWLKGPLQPMTREVLADPVLMEPLDEVFIRKTVQEFYEQGIDHGSRIWTLLMFGLWRKHNLT